MKFVSTPLSTVLLASAALLTSACTDNSSETVSGNDMATAEDLPNAEVPNANQELGAVAKRYQELLAARTMTSESGVVRKYGPLAAHTSEKTGETTYKYVVTVSLDASKGFPPVKGIQYNTLSLKDGQVVLQEESHASTLGGLSVVNATHTVTLDKKTLVTVPTEKKETGFQRSRCFERSQKTQCNNFFQDKEDGKLKEHKETLKETSID